MRRPFALIAAVGLLALAGCTSGAPERHSSPASSPRSSSVRPSPTSSSPVKTGARTVTIAGSGDVLIHPPVAAQAHADAGGTGYDFSKIYAAIAPDLRGVDLATCELETPLGPPDGPFAGYPDFSAPPQVLTTLKKIGYKTCTTASNHTLDQGAAGITRTLDELDAAGLGHTGSARSAAEATTPLIVTAPNGVKIAQLAYSFGFNGNQVPASEPWLANETNIPAILAAAHRAKQAGADIVVVSMHWGVEYTHLPTQTQQQQAQQLLASPDVDLILGDHPHAVQPLQKIDGKWVIYAMGDQVSSHSPPNDDNREGVMPIFTFTQGADGRFTVTKVDVVPTWMQLAPDPVRLIDLARAIADPATSAANRTSYQQIRTQIAGYLNAYGVLGPDVSVR